MRAQQHDVPHDMLCDGPSSIMLRATATCAITSLGLFVPEEFTSFSTSGLLGLPGLSGLADAALTVRGGFSAFAPPKKDAMPRCFMG